MFSYGLDHYIPIKLNRNGIHTEFEQFYQHLVKDISYAPDDNLTRLKTKSLKKPRSICIIKQDKGRGVVVMDRSKYTEKCLSILQTEQFTKLKPYTIKSIENKIQRELRVLKT